MAELLIELFSEEIPARMQDKGAQDFAGLITKGLDAAKITYASVTHHSTPQRVVCVVDGLPESLPDVSEEKRGPRTDAPEQAVQGFLRANGLDSLDDPRVTQKENDKGIFWFVTHETKGGPTIDMLGDIIAEAVKSLVWPKSMRWGESQFRWVRPLHHIIAVLDGKTISGGLKTDDFSISFTNETRGHRFLSPENITVKSFAQYESALEKANVILRREKRMELVRTQSKKLAIENDLRFPDDPALLSEVAGLVEWPVPVIGQFDQEFLVVPQEVLIATMRANQKYFPLMKPDGTLSNSFIITANMPDSEGHIVQGNQKVIRARLSDAKFFWDTDLQTKLDDRLNRLKTITFHDKLGSVFDRTERLIKLSGFIAKAIGTDKAQAERAAQLCKADLVTDMVFEFPEVQGIMGAYYARAQGEEDVVANAIAGHYKPAGPHDDCPQEPVSIALALAEKIDTLTGFFGIGLKPTGSKDPFALRRAGLGILRLIIENKLRLNLSDLFARAMLAYEDQNVSAIAAHLEATLKNAPKGDIRRHEQAFHGADIADFLQDRLKVMLKDQGYAHDMVDAILSASRNDDILKVIEQIEALKNFLETVDGESLITAYKRAVNIVRAEEKKDGTTYDSAVNDNMLQQHEEQMLLQALDAARNEIQPALAAEDYSSAMSAMAGLRQPIDAFFDQVIVNDDNPDIRQNRLRLLARIRETLDQVADLSRLERG